MYRTAVISVLSSVGLVFLFLLFGAAAGYAIVAKKMITQARNVNTSNLKSSDSADHRDINKLVSAA